MPKQLQKRKPQEQFLESKKLRGKGQPRQLSSEVLWPQNSSVDTESTYGVFLSICVSHACVFFSVS